MASILKKYEIAYGKIAKLKSKHTMSKNDDEKISIKEDIEELQEYINRLDKGIDADLTNKVIDHFNFYRNISKPVSEYKNGLPDSDNKSYTQLHNTDIVTEFETKQLQQHLDKSYGSNRTGAEFYNNCVDQLLNKNQKQIFNIPIMVRPDDSFNVEIDQIYEKLKTYIYNKYGIIIDVKYAIRYYQKPSIDKYGMAYLVIPSQYFANYDQKEAFVDDFKKYLVSLKEFNLYQRVGVCISHDEIPNTEIIIPPMEKTMNDVDNDKTRLNTHWAEITNVTQAAPMAIFMQDNSIINNNTTNNITNNQNVTHNQEVNINNSNNVVVGSGTNNSATSVNITQQSEYITKITMAPPNWHVKGALVNFKQLHDLYREIGGLSSSSHFGIFIARNSHIYEKQQKCEYVARRKVATYKIL